MIKKSLHTLLFCLMLGFPALAQVTTPPFTVLANNTDTANRKLYVEIMYEKPACLDYQARFELRHKGGSHFVKVDSFLNNIGTFGRSQNDSVLQRPTAGGYKLMFNMPANISVQDSPYICVISQVIPFQCRGCGAAQSNPLFTDLDIDTLCPYRGGDMIACHQRRVGGITTWEGWIQDPRDCNPYRVILMPDGRWWLAQNLNFQKDLMYRTRAQGNTGTGGTSGEYWCPSGGSADSSKSTAMELEYRNNDNAIPTVSCNTYGAIYSWYTAMSLNGRTYNASVGQPSYPTPYGESSVSQGICPDGWYIPSDYDWGYMLNSAEDVLGDSVVGNHLFNDLSQGQYGSIKLTEALKVTNSCHPHAAQVDSLCATYGNPAWSWARADYNGKISQPLVLGSDILGFSVVPAGYRYYSGVFVGAVGAKARLHSSTQNASNTAMSFYRYIDYNGRVGRAFDYKGDGRSVRCIREVMEEVILKPSLSLTLNEGFNVTLSATATSVPAGYTVDWYDAPTGGNLVQSNSITFTTTTPRRVYAELRMGAVKSPQRAKADLYMRVDRTSILDVNTMPAGRYLVVMAGGRGGHGGNYQKIHNFAWEGGKGGNGGIVEGIMTLTAATRLQIVSGKQGVDGTCGTGGNMYGKNGGWGAGGGGGAGYFYSSGGGSCSGGGGGGLSLIRVYNDNNNIIMVAGGGGGASGGCSQPRSSSWVYGPGVDGGYGGGLVAGDGGSKYDGTTRYYVGGGTQNSGTSGSNQNSIGGFLYGGGAWINGANGNASTFAAGGGGSYTSNGDYRTGSGGGGAGYYGGTGPSSGTVGGGGGSSYANPSYVTDVKHIPGVTEGDGYVLIYQR
jgi:uncharacterized protein (TIGR02145 family)